MRAAQPPPPQDGPADPDIAVLAVVSLLLRDAEEWWQGTMKWEGFWLDDWEREELPHRILRKILMIIAEAEGGTQPW